jgi:hypothetical protein
VYEQGAYGPTDDKLADMYAEYAETRSMSDSVPMDDAYYAIRAAELELAQAKALAENAAIDSEAMFAYADAQKRYNQAVSSYEQAIEQIDDENEPAATIFAEQAKSDASGSKIISELVTKPRNGAPLDLSSNSGLGDDRFTKDSCKTEECSRGLRNNNPGNIEKGGDSWKGILAGIDSRFATFSTPEDGIRAIYVIQKNVEAKGIDTIRERIYRWAPPSDGNDTEAYVAAVAEAMGISPDQPFSINDPVLGPAFVSGVITHENGSNPYTTDQIQTGQQLANDPNYNGNYIPTSGSSSEVFMNFDAYIDATQNQTPTTNQTDTDFQPPLSTTQKAVQTAYNFATDPFGTIWSWLTGGEPSTTAPSSDTSDNNKPAPLPVEQKPATDLTTSADGVQAGTKQTATATEYKFSGSITRSIIYGDDELSLSDLQKHYEDTYTTKLSVDYLCDGSVNTQTSFTKEYAAFDTSEDTSRILTATYLPITQTGSHCYFFTTDTTNVITEDHEDNNTSNMGRFEVVEL